MCTQEIEMSELLRISAEHIIRQGKPFIQTSSIKGEVRCLYQSPDGCICSATPFITDYIPEMKDMSFSTLAEKFPECVTPLSRKHGDFVSNVLQRAYDDAARCVSLEAWKEGFIPTYIETLKIALKDYNYESVILPDVITDLKADSQLGTRCLVPF